MWLKGVWLFTFMNKNVQHLHHVLSEGVQITKWTYSATFKKVFVWDKSENFARRLSTTCIASSQYFDKYKSSNALDGSVEPGEGHEWAAKTGHVGEWIMVKQY